MWEQIIIDTLTLPNIISTTFNFSWKLEFRASVTFQFVRVTSLVRRNVKSH